MPEWNSYEYHERDQVGGFFDLNDQLVHEQPEPLRAQPYDKTRDLYWGQLLVYLRNEGKIR